MSGFTTANYCGTTLPSMPSLGRIPLVIDLTAEHGPPLTTGQLAAAVGLSAQMIRLEIHAGEISAARIGQGQKRREFRIPWRECQRYAVQIGVVSPQSTQSK